MTRVFKLWAIAYSFLSLASATASEERTYRLMEDNRDWTRLEYFTGYDKSKDPKGELRYLNSIVNNQTDTALPSRFDWRERGGVTPVKSQGTCGSCWAFATTAVMESAIKIRLGKTVSLSEQQLVSCRPSYGSCDGGSYAFEYYEGLRSQYSNEFPYTATDSYCRTSQGSHEKVEEWAYVGSKGSAPTIQELKTAIYRYGPIAATVNATPNFYRYGGGIYNECAQGETNHLLTIVGWDDKEQVWILKNSWGTRWGEDGYMRIRYLDKAGYKCNRIGESAAALTSVAK